jgi:wyosine [tRNA(Phe)-imidazoG37] synthetase (radical SAM superfamily)
MKSDRCQFYPPEDIVKDVADQADKALQRKERIDYLTFVPDGEPTLDVNLGKEIELVKHLGIKVAVISNASLMWREDVRWDLISADWVSLKVDTVSETLWKRIYRPHGSLKLKAVLEGMKEFAKQFKGELTTETMLIKGFNDRRREVEKIADFLALLKPEKSYIAIPTRPPAERWVKSSDEEAINQAYQIFSGKLRHAEYLIGYEGNAFAFTGNIEEDLLSIMSVHPMREEGVLALLSKAGSSWDIIDKLMKEDKIIELEYQGKKFYMRKISSRAD